MRIIKYEDVRTTSQDLENIILQMRRAEKDFMLRELTNETFFEKAESKYVAKHDELAAQALVKLDLINNSGTANGIDSMKLVKQYLDNYSKAFHGAVELYLQKGYKNFGYEGAMRKSIHAIENGQIAYDTLAMLTLRRLEKDFLIRKDLGDVKKFDAKIEVLKANVDQNIVALINEYGAQLHNIVEIEKALGLSEKDGVKGQMRTSISIVEPLIEKLGIVVEKEVDSIVRNAYIYLILLFVVQLVIGIALSLSFAKATTISIQAIQDRIMKLSEGMFPEKIVPQTVDEIGETSHSLNNLIDRIRVAADFSGKIGNGELNVEYDTNFNSDVLAQSLQSMHGKLKEAALEDAKRNWETEGFAKFAEILRKDNNLKELAESVISNIVKYLKVNQGSFFILNDTDRDHPFLELKACYAYDRKKFVQKEIGIGEGMVGQSYVEKDIIYLTDIPHNYVSITSGLGEANPSCILIVPLMINDNIEGVIEIASFNKLEKHEINFMKKMAESIASTISGVKINERTRKLLEQSQQQGEELRAQEEEMRQNMEELSATQEETKRKEKLYQEEIKRLKLELSELKSEPVLS
jgi:methyl-accepting chemotaxis protein